MQSSTPLHVDLADLPGQARALLRIEGPDAERFVQGLLSADLSPLQVGQSKPATLLTVKGKIISEVIVLRDGSGCALALPADVQEAVTIDLDRHIIMDDVTLRPMPDAGFSLLWGAGGWRPPEGSLGISVFTASHPAPGLLVVGSAQDRRELLAEIPVASSEVFTAYRIASASPAWGHEIQPGFFPPEVGFVAAVSYTKGCYRGQEPLSRIHSRGQVNRVMVRLRASASPSEAVRLAAETRENAGTWTTWAQTPSGVQGLAILHRSVARPGQKLRAGTIEVEVESGPLGDDPGVSKGASSATVKLRGRR